MHGRAARRAGRDAGAVVDAGRRRRWSCSALRCPRSRPRSRSLHFREALEIAGARPRDEPDLAPAHERWLGEWARASTAATSSFVEGYPMVKRPFYTHPEPGGPALVQLVRPAVPGPRAGHRRPAPAPLRRLRCSAGRPRASPRAARRLPGGVPLRHAAARRLRDRPGALVARLIGRRQHPRGRRCSRATCSRLTP